MSRMWFIAVLYAAMTTGCSPSEWGTVRDESAFIDVTKSAFNPDPVASGWPGLAAFDFDNDGDIDVLITNTQGLPNLLYQNDGKGNFEEVANLAGIRFTSDLTVCTGVGDFDNDGWLDLILGRQMGEGNAADAISIRYLRNLGPDADGHVRFADGTAESGLDQVDFASSIGVGDFDNDGLLDLYIGRYNFRDQDFRFGSYLPDTPNVLLRNTGIENGVPVFEDITEQAGVAGTAIPGLAPDSSDILNRMPTWAVYVSDVNEDGFQDIFAVQEIPGGIDLFINNGDLTFSLSQADLLNKHGGWMGVASADYNRDGHLDYFMTNIGGDGMGEPLASNDVTSAWRRSNGTPFHRLLENDGAGTVTDVAGNLSVEPGVLPPVNSLGGSRLKAYEFGFGCAWLDADNDGWPDLTWTGDISNPGPLGLFRVDFNGVGRFLHNNGGTSFTDRTGRRGLFNWSPNQPLAFGYARSGRALLAIDLNGDGFEDICRTNIVSSVGVQCLFNPAIEESHWITVRLESTSGNRFGIGARVEADVAGMKFVGEVVTTTSSFVAVHPQVHFGLGEATSIDSLTVRWPSGNQTTLTDLEVDRIVTVTEE